VLDSGVCNGPSPTVTRKLASILGVYDLSPNRDKKVVGVFVRVS
jgi:hypothetical protein